MNLYRVKKSFTLMELIIVIIIISSTYLLIFSNSNFKIKNENNNFSLSDIKEYMKKNINFENEVLFVCIEDNFDCFFKIDNVINTDSKISNIFKTKPEVYEYNKIEKKLEFDSIRINDVNYDVIFELKISDDFKINELILDTLEDKVYVFNNIYSKAKIYESLSEVFELFNKNEIEVRDAF